MMLAAQPQLRTQLPLPRYESIWTTEHGLARQGGVNERLLADLRTWRHYAGHVCHNVSVDRVLLGAGRSPIASQREVACGNTSPGPPKARTQICLAVWGTVVNGRRTVDGRWYLPAGAHDDLHSERYGYFGTAGRGACPQ
jgi:hypothetical protein